MSGLETMEKYDVAIVGSGPAGCTSSIYSSRSNLKTILFEGKTNNAGGQLTKTTDIENFPGIITSGYDLTCKLREHAALFGSKIITEEVTLIEKLNDSFVLTFQIKGKVNKILSDTVIIATGANAKILNVEGVDTFWNKGISACAVCDGALPIFRDKDVMIIGGGDTAMEEALFMTKFASKVYIVHRRNDFKASNIMKQRVFENDKIEILWNSVLVGVYGEEWLSWAKIESKNILTGDLTQNIIPVSGLFFAIGHDPASNLVSDLVDVDANGYILVEKGTTKTSCPGIFAAGDVADKRYRQAITSCGSGCMAALDAYEYIVNKKMV